MIELTEAMDAGGLALVRVDVLCVCVFPPGVVSVVVERDDSAPDISARSVSAMRIASALRRNTT